MTYLLAILILIFLFLLMALGLVFAKRVLKKGCSLGPECTCKAQNIPPKECDKPDQNYSSSKE